MKKVIKIIVVIAVLCIVVSQITMYKIYFNNSRNTQVIVDPPKVSIDVLSETEVNNIALVGGFFNCNLDKDIISSLENDRASYRKICIDYTIYNQSDKTTMHDLRFYPLFSEKLENIIVGYNTGNGAYFKHVEPSFEDGLRQWIIVKIDNISGSEIYNQMYNSLVKLTYYSDGYGHSNGQKYVGMGRHEIIFRISDGKIVSNKWDDINFIYAERFDKAWGM